MELKHVFKSYGDQVVLSDVSLTFPEGRISCLFGPSGRGKTTVLRLLAGLEQPDSGTVDGVGERRASVIFQEDRLLPYCTAEMNLSVAAPDADARFWLAEVGLLADAGKHPEQLSGGMCRRVALARALAYDGEVFLMDEPFKGLDHETKLRMMALVRRSLRGKTALFITHDAEERDLLSDLVIGFD